MSKGEVKVHKNKGYTWMSNSHLREKKMSLKSKGLLSLIFSLPDTWDYSINGLVAISLEGKKSIKSALNELENFGYLYIEKLYPKKNQRKGIEYIYHIYEFPTENKFYKNNDKKIPKGTKMNCDENVKECQKVELQNGTLAKETAKIKDLSKDTKRGTLSERDKNEQGYQKGYLAQKQEVQKVALPKVGVDDVALDEVGLPDGTQINTKGGNIYLSNTKEINTNNQSIYPSSKPDYDFYERWIKENVDYDSIVINNTNKEKKENYKNIINIVVDVMCMDKENYLKINGEIMPVERVQKIFGKLKAEHIMEAENKFMHADNVIRNPRAYLISILYNTFFLLDLSIKQEVNYDLGHTY